VPFGYGFARGYALGSLQEATLLELADKWRANGYRDLQSLCQKT